MMTEMAYTSKQSQTVLHEGIYNGYKFYILSLGTHPVAYVECKLEKCCSYNDERLDDVCVHGGFTYYGEAAWVTDDKKKYLGWDYAHLNDYAGYEIRLAPQYRSGGKKWTTEEIYEEVKFVIEQLELVRKTSKMKETSQARNDLAPSERQEEVMNAVEMRKQKALNLRYKKAALAELCYDTIRNELYDIQEECDNIRWYTDGDEENLLNALDGDEEEAFEFKMAFSELANETQLLIDALSEAYVVECFDDLFVGIMTGGNGAFTIIGYDSYEEDYFRLVNGYEEDLAISESKKRLLRLTKDELISAVGQCFGIATSFLNVQYKYKCLQSAFDILNNDNASLIKQVKEIEAAYDELQRDEYNYDKHRTFDRMVDCLPERVWIE